ncbi:DUF6429 family protein [Cupriavidus sp. 8B]
MENNTEQIGEAVLALLCLNMCEQNCAWKTLDWSALNCLHDRGIFIIR